MGGYLGYLPLFTSTPVVEPTKYPTTATAEPSEFPSVTPTQSPSEDPTVMPTDDGKDCSKFHIDDFLLDCSVEFDGHDTDISTLQSEVDVLSAAVDGGATDIVSLQSNVSSVSTTVDGHVDDIVTLQTELSTVQKEVTSMDTTVDGALQTDTATLQSDVSSVTATVTVSSMSTTMDENVVDIAALQADSTSLQDDMTTLKAAVVQLSSASSVDSDSIESLRGDLQVIGDWEHGEDAMVGGDWKMMPDDTAVTVTGTAMVLTAKDVVVVIWRELIVEMMSLCDGHFEREQINADYGRSERAMSTAKCW